jgi:hypothetical protein
MRPVKVETVVAMIAPTACATQKQITKEKEERKTDDHDLCGPRLVEVVKGKGERSAVGQERARQTRAGSA